MAAIVFALAIVASILGLSQCSAAERHCRAPHASGKNSSGSRTGVPPYFAGTSVTAPLSSAVPFVRMPIP
jgi:hypothetical protein